MPTLEAHYAQLRSQHGDKAVMLVLTGLTTNTDPSSGITKRDVDDAIDKRLKALAPGAPVDVDRLGRHAVDLPCTGG